MKTSLTIEQIELALVNVRCFDPRQNIIVPNVSWGLLKHEADLLIMSKSGYLTEIEIKRLLSDLKADFKKDKHSTKNSIIQYFYYAVPFCLKDEAISLLIEHNVIVSGVITYTEDSKIMFHPIPYHGCKGNSHYKLPGRKLFLEEQLQVARLGTMRIWSLKKKRYEMSSPNIRR